MQPVECAHCNLEFPLFCHPSDGPLAKIVMLYYQWTNNLKYARRGSQKQSHRVRFHLRSNFGRARGNDAAVERSDRTENSELHIQTSELSVFGDWGRQEGVARGMS